MKPQIVAGSFSFADEFPRYKGPSRLPQPFRTRTCGEVFDLIVEKALGVGAVALSEVSHGERNEAAIEVVARKRNPTI
jgi:hypothetical protein